MGLIALDEPTPDAGHLLTSAIAAWKERGNGVRGTCLFWCGGTDVERKQAGGR